MSEFRRDEFRYTAYFCEENVWWAVRELSDRGFDTTCMQVLLFTNPSQSVVLLNQLAANEGLPVAWDYHVVLQARIDASALIFDLDSRLDFPTPLHAYLRNTFPDQAELPEHYRAWVRVIPAQSYLEHFFSDRSHMLGLMPTSEFPDYPIIRPATGIDAISLDAYRDLHADLADGSCVLTLAAL